MRINIGYFYRGKFGETVVSATCCEMVVRGVPHSTGIYGDKSELDSTEKQPCCYKNI
jgi:hypothetical protein